MRAFAGFLGTDHSTLSQILRGRRGAPARHIRLWAKKLGLSAEEAAAWIAAEHLPNAPAQERERHVRHWTAEAMGVMTEPAHWEILRLCRTPAFRADSRWLAERIGVSADEVNLALSRLLRLGLLEMSSQGRWTERTGLEEFTESEFRKVALARVRWKAAEAQGS